MNPCVSAHRLQYLTAIAVLFVCFGAGGTGQATDLGANGSFQPKWRREDARLDREITCDLPFTTIGELLETLSERTGISLSAGERDGAADVHVGLFCRRTPVHRVLDALWSLVSYRGSFWQWTRKTQDGAPAYELGQTARARGLPAELRFWVLRQMETAAEVLLTSSDGDDDQRRRALERIYGTADIARDFAFSPESLWMNVRVVKQSLSAQQLRGTLQGETTISVPLAALTPPVRDWFVRQWQARNQGAREYENGVERPEPLPSRIRIERARYGSTPAVCVIMSGLPSPWLFGGLPLEAAYRRRLRSLWLVEGDRPELEPPGIVMHRPSDDRGDPPASPPLPPVDPSQPGAHDEILRRARAAAAAAPKLGPLDLLARRMSQISAGSGRAVMIRYAEEPRYVSLTEPWNHRLRDYWAQLWNKPLMVKSRAGVQLVSSDAWPLEDAPVPIWLLRTLRKNRQATGWIPFERLTETAALLTAGQLARLRGEFPVMASVGRLRELFVWLHEHPAILRSALSDGGCRLLPAFRAALQSSLPESIRDVVDSGEARFLRIRFEDVDTPLRIRQIVIELVSDAGKPLRALRFQDRASTGDHVP